MSETHRPRSWDSNRHQHKAKQSRVLHELDHLHHLALRLLNRPEVMHCERSAQKENHEEERADSRVIPQQKTCAAQHEQRPRAANRQSGHWRALAFGVPGHHSEFGEMIEAVHKEKAARNDATD